MSNTEQDFITSTKLKIKPSGFTIVELLVVIVIIGILAAITIVSYSGITNRANVASLQSNLTNASQQLKAYQALYGYFPALDSNNCPTAPSTVDNNYCLKNSTGSTYTYNTTLTSAASQTFHLTDTNGNNSYSITDNSSPTIATTANGSTVGNACPTGFIPVPGSGTYGTNDFCVMKYAASHADATSSTQGTSTTPISAPSVQQWVNVPQQLAGANNDAIEYSQNVAGCTGCHLITEAEYMTIAQNVLSVPGNWSGAAVGSGVISSGHNDGAPNNALVPDPSDSNGNAGETNQIFAQKRTLTLTNGQVIWDLAGNVFEWTAGQTNGTTAQQPGVPGNGWGYREWTSITANGTLPTNPSPTGTGLSGASTWNSTKGIGQIDSNSDNTGLYGFRRGGNWNSSSISGVLALYLPDDPSGAYSDGGFRVSR